MAGPAKGGAKKTSAPAKNGGAKKGKSRKLHGLYVLAGDKIQRKNKTCPKCGPGYFLGVHSNRIVCGKCAYVEYSGKK